MFCPRPSLGLRYQRNGIQFATVSWESGLECMSCLCNLTDLV
jgi:hypothetical protein